MQSDKNNAASMGRSIELFHGYKMAARLTDLDIRGFYDPFNVASKHGGW